ncbi:MAG: hypothetical protein H6625_08535 [Bdellovibrionaceae bacterium]|nr:hypothetical protein [Pseudobdellovibrionaceae bacterium]
MDTNIVKHWLRLSRYAASGGNQQQWNLKIKEINKEKLAINIRINKPDSPQLTDAFGVGAMISIGCLTSTLNAVGKCLGLINTKLKVIEEKELWSTQIQLEYDFLKNNPSKDKLSTFLARRTHRGPYTKQKIDSTELNICHGLLNPEFKLLHLNSQRKDVISFVKDTTYLRLTNKTLFSELLNEVFIRVYNRKANTGLPLDTLGLSKFSEFFFKLIKYNNLFFSSKIFHFGSIFESVVLPLNKCSDIYYLQGQKDDASSWFHLGMSFQDLWLALTEKSIVLQPFANNLLIYNYFKDKNLAPYHKKHRQMLEKWNQELNEKLNINTLKPGILFRIGYPVRPAPLSPRRELTFS